MAEWAASDIALVITTSATAITAVGGVILPLISKAIEKRDARNSDRARSFLELLDLCVATANDVTAHNTTEAIRLAYLKSGTPVPERTDETSEAAGKFLAASMRIKFYAKRHNIDARNFNIAAASIIATRPDLEVVDGKLLQSGGPNAQREYAALTVKRLNDLVDAAAELIAKVDTR